MPKRRWRSARAILFLTASAVVQPAAGADWPMWRGDPGRSAASAAALPDSLHVQWIRSSPAARPAWPKAPRLHFDSSYEPVVMGRTLFLASANTDSVTAFDTRSGRQKWQFFTNGPVRFAPVIWRDKVYFGSDDGYLYCLNRADGGELWKVRGGHADLHHLGNERLVSFWPVRGGPVIADGVVYFAAGIWPCFGIYVRAVDASSGKVLWTNTRGAHVEKIRIDHDTQRDGSLSPQGYLAIEGDRLIVPNGRSMPAAFDRRTGELLWYTQGFRHGHSRVTVHGRDVFVGSQAVLNVATGHERSGMWDQAQAGTVPPEQIPGRWARLNESPGFDYKFLPGCDGRSALAGGAAYGLAKGVFYTYDLTRPRLTRDTSRPINHATRGMAPWRWDVPELWRLDSGLFTKRSVSEVVIKAGPRLYGQVDSTILAVDVPKAGAKARIAWKKNIEGTPSSMIAGDDRLFVVTRDGRLYCFGEDPGEAGTDPIKNVPMVRSEDASGRAAADLLAQTGVSEGYCLVLGLEDESLVEQLLVRSTLRIIAVERDPGKVERLRHRLIDAGFYGLRAEVHLGEPKTFSLPPYLASLAAVDRSNAADFIADRSAMAKLFTSLRPYGGKMCLRVSEDLEVDPAKWSTGERFAQAKFSVMDSLLVVSRPGPLPGSAPWTHETGDSARTFFNPDGYAKTPLGVLWYGDSDNYGMATYRGYNSNVKPQAIQGRMFALERHGPNRILHAVDVYTGRLLWKQKVAYDSRYVSTSTCIYLAAKGTCTALDPATGEQVKTFSFLEQGHKTAPLVSDIRIWQDVAVIAYACPEDGKGVPTNIVAMDRDTGKVLWRRKARQSFAKRALAVGAGRVFLSDHVSPRLAGHLRRRDDTIRPGSSTLMALDVHSGHVIWTQDQPYIEEPFLGKYWDRGSQVKRDDFWFAAPEFVAYSKTSDILLTGRSYENYGRDAKTGKEIWHKTLPFERWTGYGPNHIVRDKTFITQNGFICDLKTGEVVDPILKKMDMIYAPCNYAVASSNLITVRRFFASFLDLKTYQHHQLGNIRAGCGNSYFVAEGVVNCPQFAGGCICNYAVQTAFAMVHMPGVDELPGSTAAIIKSKRPSAP